MSFDTNVLKFYTSRGGEYAFRLGGEEFGVIVSDMNEEKYRALAEQIRTSVEKLAILHEKNDAVSCVSVSIGIALYNPANLMTSDELYKEADTQLYRAKENGRNQVILGE